MRRGKSCDVREKDTNYWCGAWILYFVVHSFFSIFIIKYAQGNEVSTQIWKKPK